MSELDQKLQRGIIELDKGDDKKAFEFFKDVFEGRTERYMKSIQEHPNNSAIVLDALSIVHALVWLRIAEAGKDKKRSLELLGRAVSAVETARVTLVPLVNNLAEKAKEKNIKTVLNKALGLLAATTDLEEMVKQELEAKRKEK